MDKMYFVFSCFGFVGGLLCCTGDIFFDLKGRGNKKLGTSKNIDSNWTKMADWRFGWSIALALIGDALVCLGFYSLGMFGLIGMLNLLLSGIFILIK